MRRLGRLCLTTVLLLTGALVVVGGAYGESVRIEENAGAGTLAVRSQSDSGVEVHYVMDAFRMEPITVDGELRQTIGLPGVMLPNNAGAPDLAGFSRYIAFPQGATVSVEVLSTRTRTYRDVYVAPAPVIPQETDDRPLVYREDASIFSRDAYYPEAPVQLSPPQKMRGVDVVLLGITPFQYNPVTRELVVYTEIDLRVEFQGGNGQYGDQHLRNRFWEPMLRDHLLNYPSLPAIDFAQARDGRESYDYAIVVPDHPDFIAWGDTLKTWRELQGIRTRVVTTTDIGGTTTGHIEQFCNDAYNQWGIAAFLILGDYPGSGDGGRDSGITSPFWNSYCVSDNIYADVDGDDLPDMAHGRIVARDASDLQTMINKMLSYERQPYTDAGFYQNPIIAGGWQTERWFILCDEICYGFQANELGKTPTREYAIYSGTPGTTWSSNQNTYMLLDYFGPDGLGYIPSTPAHLTDWGGNATRLNNDMNTGAFMLLHRDHGWTGGWGEPDYDLNDLLNLSNTMYPFVFSINCQTGKYNLAGECFSERFHRLSHGALGVIAASETSYSFVNDTFIFGLMDGLWPAFMPDYGERSPGEDNLRTAFAMASGKIFLQGSSWPYNSGDKTVTYHLFHHFGDAFMTMYSEIPQPLSVSHDEICMTDAPTFAIQADAGALIGLTVDGEIIGVAEATGLMQDVTITPQTQPGDLRVTVTKANYYRYDERVPIIPPSGPYLVVEGQVIDDDLLGDSAGNNDGGADAGESLELILELKNTGSDTATNVRATIICEDANVMISDAYEEFGDIAPDATVACLDDYELEIAPGCPDGYIAEFDVTIESDNRLIWDKSFSVQIDAPVIEYVDYTIDDTAGGNGNGRVEPGETFLLLPHLQNSGGESATNLSLRLIISHMHVTVLQDETGLALLPAGGQGVPDGAFEVEVDAACDDPHLVTAGLTITADWGQSGAAEFDIPVGGFFDDMEAGEGNWTSYLVTTGFTNQWHRSTQRNYTPAGEWSWKFGDTAAGDYASLSDGALESEPVNLRQESFLRFRHWMDAEVSGSYPEYCYDGGMVEMSVNEGPWEQITPVGDYSHLIRAGGTPGPWPGETPVYSGTIDWAEEVFELNDLSGQARFRFRFGSDGAVTGEGWYIDEVEFFGSGMDPSGVTDGQPLALRPAIQQNRPNPFHPRTTIVYELPARADVRLRIFDPAGRLVRTLVDGSASAGAHYVTWDGQDEEGGAVGSGIYFYHFETNGVSETRKMILAR